VIPHIWRARKSNPGAGAVSRPVVLVLAKKGENFYVCECKYRFKDVSISCWTVLDKV